MRLQTLPAAWGITVVRVMAGLIIMIAGLEKLGSAGLTGFNVGTYGIPLVPFWAAWIPLQEAIGGLLILTGLGARWVAILFIIEYSTTAFVIKVPRPAPFGGWESMRIDLMLWAAAIAIVLVGSGAFALENLLFRRGRPAMTERRATT